MWQPKKIDVPRNEITNLELVSRLEGGSVEKGEWQGCYVLFFNQTVLYEMLAECDLEGVWPTYVYVFNTAHERDAYIREHVSVVSACRVA